MRDRIILIVLYSCILLLVFIKVVYQDSTSTQGNEYEALQAEISELKKQNMLLRQQIYRHESLTTIASEAAGLGFINGWGSTIFVTK